MSKKFKQLFTDLGINEKISKKGYETKERKQFNSIRNNIPLVKNLNMMADFLHLPSYRGYKYLFVICDLASGNFDIEPVKNLNSENALKAMKKCFTREYVKEPEYSIQTDGGPEFKDAFHRYLYEHSILHKYVMPDRHKQNSMIESLNRQLGRIFNVIMNNKELETGKVNKNWLDSIDFVRDRLNEIRKKKTYTKEEIVSNNDIYPNFSPEKEVIVKKKGKGGITVKETKNVFVEPKFNIGDEVHHKLEVPYNALGKKQPTKKFREGDVRFSLDKKKIVNIFTMNDKPYYRYYLEGLPNVSYADFELKENL